MSDMPERIWAYIHRNEFEDDEGYWDHEGEQGDGSVEYVRADLYEDEVSRLGNRRHSAERYAEMCRDEKDRVLKAYSRVRAEAYWHAMALSCAEERLANLEDLLDQIHITTVEGETWLYAAAGEREWIQAREELKDE